MATYREHGLIALRLDSFEDDFAESCLDDDFAESCLDWVAKLLPWLDEEYRPPDDDGRLVKSREITKEVIRRCRIIAN